MMDLSEEDLIHDWNARTAIPWPSKPPMLIDHTLPAAALTPSVKVPEVLKQAALVRSIASLGIRSLAIGTWPQAHVQDLYKQLHSELEERSLRLWVENTGRALPASRLNVYVSHRQSGWTSQLKQLAGRGTLVIQDVTRIHPDALFDLLRTAGDAGCEAVCLCDDTGRATPSAAARVVGFACETVRRLGSALRVEWSGRNDRSLALYNALSAWRAGARAIHCAFFGLGEGSGLIATELLLVNLVLVGSLRRDLRSLGKVSHQVADALTMDVHANQPVVGADAFRTATGVHAAAIIKAQKKGHDWLADMIYSGVPANQFGFTQIIEVGPMAGASNVMHWLKCRDLPAHPELVSRILAHAKGSEKILSEQEMLDLIACDL